MYLWNHDDMIKGVILELNEDEERILIESLRKITNFFEEKYNFKKYNYI